MASLYNVAKSNRGALYHNMFKDLGVQRIRTVSRPGGGIGTALTFADGTPFNCNLQLIVRRPDPNALGMTNEKHEEYTLKYPMDITLSATDRVAVNGVEFEIRKLYDIPDSSLCKQALLGTLPTL